MFISSSWNFGANLRNRHFEDQSWAGPIMPVGFLNFAAERKVIRIKFQIPGFDSDGL